MARGRTPFGQRMFDARKKAKLTQVKVCEQLGLSQGTLAELEKKGLGSSHTTRFAALYGVAAIWLATGEGEQTADAPLPQRNPAWPFERFSSEEWERLTDREKGAAEEALLQAIAAIRGRRPVAGPSGRDFIAKLKDGTVQQAASAGPWWVSAPAESHFTPTSPAPPLVAAEPPPPAVEHKAARPRKTASKVRGR